MALNLIKAQHQVLGYDISKSALNTFVLNGGKSSCCIQELAEQCEILITMLQTADQIQQLCCDMRGLYSFARPGTLHIDCSTIGVSTAQELYREALKQRLLYLDAPVSGGTTGARTASLTFLVGGDLCVYELAKPILEAMGKQVIHTGVNGSGQAAKICNNMLLGINMAAVAECFLLGKKLGLDSKKIHEVVMKSSGQSWVMERYVPVPNVLENVPANNDFNPGFTVNMMLKDLNISQNEAQNGELNLRLGHLAKEMFQEASNNGLGELDFSAIIKILKL